MQPRFAGRVALVTGAASGIGRAVAARFSEEQAAIAAVDLNPDGAEEAAIAIRKAGGRALAIEADVADDASVRAMAAAAEAGLGAPSILVHCAGIGKTSPLLETDLDDWKRTLDVNLTGSFLTARALLPAMAEAGYGRVLLIGSINSRTALRHRNAYAASKAGVRSLAELIALEFADRGVTANCIAPGPVDTALARRMHDKTIRDAYLARLPIKRYGQPEEIAAAAAFLASEEAGYITGHLLDVDGGFAIAGL